MLVHEDNVAHQPAGANVHLAGRVHDDTCCLGHRTSGGAQGLVAEMVQPVAPVVHMSRFDGVKGMAPELDKVATHALAQVVVGALSCTNDSMPGRCAATR